MFELFISDVSDFLSIKNKLESKELEIEEADVNRFMIHLLSSGKLFVDFNENQIKQNIPKIVRSLIVYMVLQAISMISILLIDFAIL